MKNIFLFGECMIELMNSSQEKSLNYLSTTMQQSFAGDVFNTAVYLKRTFIDMNVHLVTAVGKDQYSLDMIQYFEQENIGTEYVFKSENKIPGLYSIQLDSHGERSFTYWREDSAAREVMSFIDEQLFKHVSEGDLIFFSGISLAVISPKDRPKFWLLIDTLKSSGLKVVFDPNYRARLWETPEEAKEQFEHAFSIADVLLPGVDDFEKLYSLSTSEAVYEFCKPYDFEELVIKNGEAGISCYYENQSVQFNIEPINNVVDTTSAGDSFNGVYIGARAKGLNLHSAVELASKAAGIVIQHRGAIIEQDIYQQFIKELNI
ncbi:MAG: sugar kinase [Colwelliaceae bacterium]|jgi:2-dehydro-3-deoxygluconokinase|nr:sugar kinase [Colwelliaceae bacterium]